MGDGGFRRERMINTECWQLFKVYSDMPDTREGWQAITDSMAAVIRKYDGDPFVVDIMLAYYKRLEARKKCLQTEA